MKWLIRSILRRFGYEIVQATPASVSASVVSSDEWQLRTRIFDTFPSEADIAMVGDSLVAVADWSRIFPRLHIANFGIGGDTVRGACARVEQILRSRPKQIFVMLGINDITIRRPTADIADDYAVLLRSLASDDAEIIILSTILTTDGSMNERVRELNGRLQKLAYRYVDLNAVLAPNGVLDSAAAADAIHLNAEGYRRWRDALFPLLPARRP